MINEIKNACLKAFESGEVGYIIGWQATRFADKTTPLFMRSAEDVEKLVWNKYCVNSTAKYALEDKYPEKKIGIILRGCDSRAVARMISDKQLKRENLYLIGVVCLEDGEATLLQWFCDEYSEEKEVLEKELEYKMERWEYLSELNEKINEARNRG